MVDNRALRHRMIEAVTGLGVTPQIAENAVDVCLGALGTPDAFMIEGGLTELNLALGSHPDPEHGPRYRRDLVRVIWRAILDRAR